MSTKSADPMPESMQSGPPVVPSRLKWTRLRSHEAFWIGVLACMNVAFFAEVLFTDRTFFVRDVSTFHYPLKKLVTEAYARGEWPLWNPYIQMGQPSVNAGEASLTRIDGGSAARGLVSPLAAGSSKPPHGAFMRQLHAARLRVVNVSEAFRVEGVLLEETQLDEFFD